MREKVLLYRIIKMILLFTIFVSCENSKDDKPQITCEYFSKLKPAVLDYNEKGLDIGINIGEDVQINNVKSYGITYGVVGDPKKRTIESLKPLTDNLNKILLDSLVCGLEYEITGKITMGNSNCISKPEYFTAQKSYPPSPWCAGIYKSETGTDESTGVSINNKPFVIFQNNSFYSIEDQSVLSPKARFPLSGNTGVKYAIFTIGKYGYFKSSDSNELYRYDSEGNNWENLGDTNLYSALRYFGGQLNGIGYFFNSRSSYRYDINTSTFIELSNYQEKIFINNFQTKSNLYVINENFQILKFNISTGNWEYIATYPGNKSKNIVSFVNNNKVYIGLAHNYYYPGYESFYDIYELDLGTIKWKQLKSFPYKFENAWGIGSVSTENNSYIIYRDQMTYFTTFVWKFNPLEIIYK